MNEDSALENLQTIRKLMERAALYRRALAPLMTYAGLLGIAAAVLGILARVATAAAIISYWLAVAFLGVIGVMLLVRRQAFRSAEPFWSPPARRVAMAMLPCLVSGLCVSLWFLFSCSRPAAVDPPTGIAGDCGMLVGLAGLWAILYGCALNAAGFFASRGLRLLGWLFVAAGIGLFAWLLLIHRQDQPDAEWQTIHWIMGVGFGLSQLAYGIYLYLTGEEQNAL